MSFADAQPLAGHAAKRKAAKINRFYLQLVEKFDDVSTQPIERIAADGRIRRAVAALIIAQHSEMGAPGGKLRFPHLHVSAQGVGQQQDRGTFFTIEPIGDAAAVSRNNELLFHRLRPINSVRA